MNKLNGAKVEAALPQARTFRLADGGGLYLEVRPNGARYWRLAYRFAGKQKTYGIGVYPTVTLKDARKRRDDAKRQLENDIDPCAKRRADRQAERSDHDLFSTVSAEWMSKRRLSGKTRQPWSDRHTARTKALLNVDLLPVLGKMRVGAMRKPDIIRALRKIEHRGALQQVPKAKSIVVLVLDYAISGGLCEANPARHIGPELFAMKPVNHHAAITEPEKVGRLLRDIDAYIGHAATQYALRLLPLLAVRPGELRNARWEEIHFKTSEWHIPPRRMKVKDSDGLIVPLAKQTLEILRELHKLTGGGELVLPGLRPGKPLSDNTFNAALRSLGYTGDDQVAHGFRAIARTMLDEKLGFSAHLIEHQIGHMVRDAQGRTYNRTKHLPERHSMMQAWANYLDGLRNSSQVTNLG